MKVDFSLIRNFYEQHVFDRVSRGMAHHPEIKGAEALLDVACIALNRLPPKYIRYDADLFFYMTPKERTEIEAALDEAVQAAVEFVARREAAKRNTGPA